jgi:hypothetical protein
LKKNVVASQFFKGNPNKSTLVDETIRNFEKSDAQFASRARSKDIVLVDDSAEVVAFCDGIDRELSVIRDNVYAQNPELVAVLVKTGNIFAAKDLDSKMRSLYAIYCQSIEKTQQEMCVSYMVELGVPLSTIIPCQDGFMIKKEYQNGEGVAVQVNFTAFMFANDIPGFTTFDTAIANRMKQIQYVSVVYIPKRNYWTIPPNS